MQSKLVVSRVICNLLVPEPPEFNIGGAFLTVLLVVSSLLLLTLPLANSCSARIHQWHTNHELIA